MKKTVLYLTFLVYIVAGATAQEKTEQLFALYSENSIIREINMTKWVVYSHNNGPTFSLVIDGNSLVDFIILPDTFQTVSDFTIFGSDEVYFCGMLKSGVPVLGHFKLASFPTTTIYYSGMTGVDTLTAIKTFDSDIWPPKGMPRHVLMTGRKGLVGILVDALTLPNGWDTYYITLKTSEGRTSLLDDIDVLDNYVVVASHETIKLLDEIKYSPLVTTGYVWYIKKPSPEYLPFLTTVEYFPIRNVNPYKQLKLTACEGNACVSAAMAYRNNVIGINVFGHDYPYTVETARLAYDSTNFETLIDICYDQTMQKTELLVQCNVESSTESRIYTLTNPTYAWSTISGRVYSGHKINSLITRAYGSGLFIGSGVDPSDPWGLNLYRYTNTANYYCFQQKKRSTEDIECRPIAKGSRSFEYFFHEAESAQAVEKGTILNTICDQTNKNQ